ncbi:sulfatase family protein [Singulisphaera sp. PoT]|uniref:sulfatase family protein n=1 Tax=Singulisphaera sp. PoT TaxID=3411797 RepID=UPI003BF4D0C1
MCGKFSVDGGSIWVRLLACLCPSPLVLGLIAFGCLLDVALLGQANGSIFRDGKLMTGLALIFEAWLWVTAGWMIWGGSLAVARVTSSWPAGLRTSARCGLVLLVAVLLFLDFTSWGLYLRLGQFANAEAFEFVLLNRRMIWLYLVQVEWTDLCALGLLTAVLIGVIPWTWRAICRSRWPVQVSPSLLAARFLTWSVLTFVLIGSVQAARREESAVRRQCWKEAIERRLDPVITLAASLKDSWYQEKIEPCLSASDLRPLSQGVNRPAKDGKRPRSVIFVAVESLRNDVVYQKHQGREVMPALNQLAANGLNLTRAYAQSTHSDYSDVCVASSLFPLRTRSHHFYRPDDPWPKTLIYDLLKPEGYSTAVISAQNEAWGAMDAFLKTPGLDLFYDAQSSGLKTRVATADSGFSDEFRAGNLRAGKLDDGDVTSKAIEWIGDQARKDKPFFLSLNFQSSHFPYELGPKAELPFQPSKFDFEVSFIAYPVDKTPVVRNAYFNALYYCDKQLGRLVAALRDLGRLEDTILVVYGENGEAFHENGFVTHAQKPVEPALRVACVIHSPRDLKPATEDYPAELVDVVPTTLGMMNWPMHPNFQGINLLAADRPRLEERLLYFHTENPLTRCDALLLGGRWKFAWDRRNGEESLFDLASDPSESTNLLVSEPTMSHRLRTLLRQWRRRQLAYHHYPHYFEHSYPPAPPTLNELTDTGQGGTQTVVQH